MTLANALGYPMNYTHPSRDHGRDRAPDADASPASAYEKLDELGSMQWPCNDEAPEGTPIMHVGRLRARQGQVHDHRVRADRRAHRPALPADADHRPHPVAVQCRRADAAHARTSSGTRRTCWRSIRTTPSSAASTTATGWRWPAAPGETTLRGADHRADAAGRRLHHLPPSGHAGQRHHHRLFGLGDQLPRIQGDGGAGAPSNRPTEWQEDYAAQARAVAADPGRRSRRARRRSEGRPGRACARAPRAGRSRVAAERRRSRWSTTVHPGGDDGDAARPRGFRRRLQPDRGHRRPGRRDREPRGRPTGAEASRSACGCDDRAGRWRARRRSGGPVGCGLCGIVSLEQALRPLPGTAGAARSPAGRGGGDRRPGGPAAHGETSGARRRLRPGGGASSWCEDVGRHNALDKLVGAMARRRDGRAARGVVLTSRVSVEWCRRRRRRAPVRSRVSAADGRGGAAGRGRRAHAGRRPARRLRRPQPSGPGRKGEARCRMIVSS